MKKTIAVGADHAGFPHKKHLKAWLHDHGYQVTDVGTDSGEKRVDALDYAQAASRLVAEGKAERAILVCGSGVCMAMVANKIKGIRAVNAHSPKEAELARQHNDVNVLTLAGRDQAPENPEEIVRAFLETTFNGGRYARRLEKLRKFEQGTYPGSGNTLS